MTSPVIAAFAQAWRPQDVRTVAQWAEEHVTIPGSARARRFDSSASPWLVEPLEWFSDPRVKEQVLILPTGAGKTTFFDVTIPHAIAEAPGNILLAMQTDPDAREHMEDRLMPILNGCEPIAGMLAAANRHAIRKDAIVLPHMSIYVGGANKTNFQRKSVRHVFLDEAWLIKHGLVEEARARLHNRWNGRVVIVSQGGNQHFILGAEKRETELFAAWQRSDRREWSMLCPECGNVSPWKLIHLRYADSEDDREVIESARYHCPSCPATFEDRPEVRRALSSGSRYVATNPTHLPNHHGWHAPAVGLFHERWGDLALGWRKANQAKQGGDLEPLKIFVTKRLAEFWKEEEDAPDIVLGASGYNVTDHEGGELIEGELFRFATIDRQRDHFWMQVRAWRADGSSRLLTFRKMLSIEACRDLQQRYKVKDDFTAEDASHMPSEVYEDCARFGWVAFFGDQVDGYDHFGKPGAKPVRKFYSPLKKAMAPSGKIVRYIRWSNEKVKDILFNLCAGRGPAFEVPDDIEDPTLPENQRYHSQIRSEVKRDVINKTTNAVTRRYVKTRRHNHAVDTEGMGVVFALIKGVVGHAEIEEPPTEE